MSPAPSWVRLLRSGVSLFVGVVRFSGALLAGFCRFFFVGRLCEVPGFGVVLRVNIGWGLRSDHPLRVYEFPEYFCRSWLAMICSY